MLNGVIVSTDGEALIIGKIEDYTAFVAVLKELIVKMEESAKQQRIELATSYFNDIPTETIQAELTKRGV